MFLGIDLGTSAVKVVLVDESGEAVAETGADLEVQRPEPLWSEQDPEAWWTAVQNAMDALHSYNGAALSRVKGIGLSGQMHGATLLDAKGDVLRPAILWNDGRSAAECAELEEAVPNSRTVTGNVAMPGFTAPKLLWVRKHEGSIHSAIAKVLLPKDYIRFRLTGEYASDYSDSAGTLWLDVGRREWSETMLAACGLGESHMPTLYEGTENTGTLRSELAHRWGMGEVPVAAGGGDNAAGAAGVGVIAPGQAFLSLGTSGVYFVSCDRYRPNPDGGVHTFCHCIPGVWHQMSVILSAASCLTWVSKLIGAESESAALDARESAGRLRGETVGGPIFLPYLSGERTPHNDPNAQGVFFGMTHETDGAALVEAVLEGVAFAFADGESALRDAGTAIDSVCVIGGGAQSDYWGQVLADVLGRPLHYRAGGEAGPAYGAARLARIAVTGETPDSVCSQPEIIKTVEPDVSRAGYYEERLALYRRLYAGVKEAFSAGVT